MAQVQELKSVVKETLENRGVLGEIKARVRAEVFHALDDPQQKKPQLSNENMLINELIREYLEFNQYKYTSSVLLAESGQPTSPLDRQFLAGELNIVEDRNTAGISASSFRCESRRALQSDQQSQMTNLALRELRNYFNYD